MKHPLAVACLVFLMAGLITIAPAKEKEGRSQYLDPVELPPRITPPPELGASMYRSAAVGTTVLGWWQFDGPGQTPDPQGWTASDFTVQVKTYFHVDGPGCHGASAINGAQSMWCGQWATTEDPWCAWATLPGYGSSWDQSLVSPELVCGEVKWDWTVVWDSEAGYDFSYAEYWDAVSQVWVALPVDSGVGNYTGTGGPLVETHTFSPPAGTTKLRWHFVSDGAGSDEDGLQPTNEGAIKLDDIQVWCDGSPVNTEDWEDESCDATASNDGFWTGEVPPGFGLYAQLHRGGTVVQEDPCNQLLSNFWGFFDDPVNTNYACGGWPLQGAMPYGPDENGLYMDNDIRSPWVPNIGNGSQYVLEFKVYRDLPLDNLQIYTWHVRGRDAVGCPSGWMSDFYPYYGGSKDWFIHRAELGPYIPGDAVDIQVAVSVVDACPFVCGIVGSGACHSHAPLIDQVRLFRVDFHGPQWQTWIPWLWQDNFPEEGGIDPASSFARCDMAAEMAGESGRPPGDSLVVQVTDPNGLADDNTGGRPGKAVYVFVRVTDRHGNPKAGKNGTAIQSPDNQAYDGDPYTGLLRWPWVGTVTANGVQWDQYRMDLVYTEGGSLYENVFCCDLMDLGSGPTGPHYAGHDNENAAANTGMFTPGDVIWYFFGAKNTLNEWSYWHTTLKGQAVGHTTTDIDEAANVPCEWSVLPDAGLLPGDEGDILFVDNEHFAEGSLAQLYFDWAFKYLDIEDRVDRFDILRRPSLASRVKDYTTQLIGDPTEIYQKVLWSSARVHDRIMQEADFLLCGIFLNTHPDNPGWYCSGDNFAEEWVTLGGAGAVAVKSIFMNFNVITGDHVAVGEPVSPLMTQSVGSPIGPEAMYAYGGCPLVNDFDVLEPTGSAFYAMEYTTPGHGAVVAQATDNPANTTARFVLSGFGFDVITDDELVPPQAAIDRANHLRDILIWFENILDDPVGADPVVFENRLENNYPNPFNPVTTIEYSVAERGHVSLRIYNAAGQLVKTVIDEAQSPRAEGFTVTWNGLNDQGQPVSSGVYFYKLVTKGFSRTKKMVLLK